MINKYNIKDYSVFVKKGDEKFLGIFSDFLAFNTKVTHVFRNISDTKVMLIDTIYGKFVLKVFHPQKKNGERFFKSCLKGDYYENLFFQTKRIRNEGCKSINDFYLLAEKKTFRFVHTYIMLIEYIEGTELSDMPYITQELKLKIQNAIHELHQHGMVSGDAHKGNFIIQGDNVRIIDLSGKRASAQRKAKDRIDLERHYAIKNDKKDMGYYLLIGKKKIRNFLRQIKGKQVR